MRIIVLIAVAGLWSGTACAQASGAAPAAAAPPTCTTVTTVVKRGDTVLSTTSTTRCDDAAASGGGFRPQAVLEAPEGVFKALALGGGVGASPANVRGDWRTIEAGSRRGCHLFLGAQAGAAGYAAHPSGCTGVLARVTHWKFVDNAVGLYAEDGAELARLGGERERLTGAAAAGGEPIVLER